MYVCVCVWCVSDLRRKQLLQIGCSIMEGNSGGPVINANGDVVGIAAMGKSSGKGIGSLSFAISIDQATRIIDALR